MQDLSFIHDYLKKNMKQERYIHSINVANVAHSLAKHYGIDENKAELAGLIHDCAKEESYEKLAYYARNCGFPVDEESFQITQILHGPASAYIARQVLGVKDEEILSSIRYHVTGKENMTIMEKIIFIADYIEPGRKFQGVEKVRTMVYEDIDKALLIAFDQTIMYIIERKMLLHHDTVSARNYLIKNS